MRVNKQLDDRLQQAVAAAGYEYVGSEIVNYDNNSLIRIYIDAPNGVTITDCEIVTKQVSYLLDVDEPFAGSYRLEVSSPGLARPLFKLEQYQRFIGQVVKLKLRHLVDGKRNYKGKLIAVNGTNIVIEIEQKHYTLEYTDVDKANLCID
ncbi:MAG: ribosome maturation factor RimP [Pseudomonadota bacterium]